MRNTQDQLGRIGQETTGSMSGPHSETPGALDKGTFTRFAVDFPWESHKDPPAWLEGLIPGLAMLCKAVAGASCPGLQLKPRAPVGEITATLRSPDKAPIVDEGRFATGGLVVHVDGEGGGRARMTMVGELEPEARSMLVLLQGADCRWDFGPTLDVEPDARQTDAFGADA